MNMSAECSTEEESHQGIAVGPSEVPLEHLVVEAEPLVVAAQTCAVPSGKQVNSSWDAGCASSLAR